MGNEPTDPITPLVELASQLHELYLSYIKAGFTEAQSMQIPPAYTQFIGEQLLAHLAERVA